MNETSESLAKLGWSSFFETQLTNSDELARVVRVASVRRTALEVQDGHSSFAVLTQYSMLQKWIPAVGDWLVLDGAKETIVRALERKSILQRQPAQRQRRQATTELDPMVANSDRAFIVSSCNDEFNESRIERFLVLCHSGEVEPIVVLTKIDLCADVEPFSQRAQAISNKLNVHLINCLDAEQCQQLSGYFTPNQTITLLGSSGVGKSTLINTLSGNIERLTGQVRDSDQRGRHTTTERKLLAVPASGYVVDMPGLKAVGVSTSTVGIRRTFPEIWELAADCRFRNCQHGAEPGCKVKESIESGALSERRFRNYQKMFVP